MCVRVVIIIMRFVFFLNIFCYPKKKKKKKRRRSLNSLRVCLTRCVMASLEFFRSSTQESKKREEEEEEEEEENKLLDGAAASYAQ